MSIYEKLVQGRLVLGDGSIYDGLWRYGKRSGLGTFYFCNGDVFQGSWRDDVMHGKVCHMHIDIFLMANLLNHLLNVNFRINLFCGHRTYLKEGGKNLEPPIA